MLPRQFQHVRDQAFPNIIFGVLLWPIVRGANAVFREFVVEPIRRPLALLPNIEINCQVLDVGGNGCSEHTANVSKHVLSDPQLGFVDSVDDALDAHAFRVFG